MYQSYIMNIASNEVIVPYHGAEKVLVAVRKIIFDTQPGTLRPMSTQIMIKTLVSDGMPEALAKKLPSQIRKGKPLFLEWKAAFLSGRFMQKIGRSIKEPDSPASASPSSSSCYEPKVKRDPPSSFNQYTSSLSDSYQSFFENKKQKMLNHGMYDVQNGTMKTSTAAACDKGFNQQNYLNMPANYQHNSFSDTNYCSMVHPYSNNFNPRLQNPPPPPPLPPQNQFSGFSPNNNGYYYFGVQPQQHHHQQPPHNYSPPSNHGQEESQPVLSSSLLISPSSDRHQAQWKQQETGLKKKAFSFDSHVFQPMKQFPSFNGSQQSPPLPPPSLHFKPTPPSGPPPSQNPKEEPSAATTTCLKKVEEKKEEETSAEKHSFVRVISNDSALTDDESSDHTSTVCSSPSSSCTDSEEIIHSNSSISSFRSLRNISSDEEAEHYERKTFMPSPSLVSPTVVHHGKPTCYAKSPLVNFHMASSFNQPYKSPTKIDEDEAASVLLMLSSN